MTSSLRHIATEPANLSHKANAIEKGAADLLVENKASTRASESDLSGSTFSLSQESQPSDGQRKSPLHLALPSANGPATIGSEPDRESDKTVAGSRLRTHRGSEWEVLEGLKEGQRCEEKPEKFEGNMLKRRKWPLKGWHKRYFSLDKGILNYSKTPAEMAKGKIHGTLDVGLSVISTKERGRRIDIDAEEFIYHLKVKNRAQFQNWVAQLRHHRLYRQHEIAFGSKEAPRLTTPVEDVSVEALFKADATIHASGGRDVSRHVRSPISSQSRVAAWILDSSAIDQGNKDLATLQEKLVQLSSLLQQLEAMASTAGGSTLELPDIDNPKKDRRRFLLRKTKKSKASSGNQDHQQGSVKSVCKPILNKQNTVEIVVSETPGSSSTENFSDGGDVSTGLGMLSSSMGLPIKSMSHLSSSHPSLATGEEDLRPNSLPESSSLCKNMSESTTTMSYHKCQEEFLNLANQIHGGLRTVLRSLQTERERLKQALEVEGVHNNTNSGAVISSLRNSLTQALQQNSDLRQRLQRIHTESDIAGLATHADSPGANSADEPTLVHQPLQPSLSHESSSVLSNSEYFDAAENLSNCTTSSEASFSDEESFCTELSDEGTEYTPAPSVAEALPTSTCTTGRRSKLPAPKPDSGDFSLWSLLCKNIGKDLSKVSMPVTLNEPLSVLQRMCEELEYSELLDKAAELDDPFERMVYVAAFAVSAYSSACHRAGHKPFNPLLGETYECVREDRGFRFIAEQVSHHPPISACYAESKNFVFWQDMRIKTKFWGKSMEIMPIGNVHVFLPRVKSNYRWNKVTTCVHNLFSGQRWVDQYGEMTIADSSLDITCRLTFVKASYWSSKRHEVYGTITTSDGEVVHRLFGKWNEALYCGVAPSVKCIWRPGAMPEDYELYYGFSRFAIELNELNPELEKYLPPTDTRFRPDQRLLEEGNIQGAENVKMQLEQAQRDRRRRREEMGIEYEPRWFRKEVDDNGEEQWVFSHTYWDTRANPGFASINFADPLW